MLVYLCFFFALSSVILLAIRVPASQGKILISVVFLFLILFAGLRGLVGADTLSYLSFYDLFKSSEMVGVYLLRMEPFFVLLVALHSNIIDSKFLYLLMMSAFQGWLLYLVFRNSSNKYLFLLCYVLLFYLNFHFNTTRAAIAVMLFLISLTSESKKVKVLSAILAPGFHLSILFFYPLFFTHLNIKRFLVLVFLLALGLVLLSENIDFFLAKYNAYEDYFPESSSGVSLYGAFMSLNVLASVFFLRKFSSVFLGASFMLLLSFAISEFYSIGYRLVTIGLLLYLFFLVEELSRRASKVGYIFFWVPVLLTFFLLIRSIADESSRLEGRLLKGEDISNVLNSTYIPYEFYWGDDDIEVGR